MNEELKQAIAKQLPIMYPELFDDDNATKIVDSLITQAVLACRQYTVSEDELSVLVRLYTAHLLYTNQHADGQATTIKADVFQISYASDSGTDDIYLQQFMDMLNVLGMADWGIQFL